ncbi:MAG: DUF4433 domain-containing protein [Mariprofundales bacterium]
MSKRVTELHCIMPIVNIPSVMAHGILCHEEAEKLKHHSVAMQEIQNKRDNVQVPGGLKLHQYANLYFDARNPMMYKRYHQAAQLCVLRVSHDVIRLDHVVVSDQNASSRWVRFLSPTEGMKRLNFDMIFAENWNHPEDQILHWQHKSAKCAEVLIPHCVPVVYIQGAYVVGDTSKESLRKKGFGLDLVVNPHLFFA